MKAFAKIFFLLCALLSSPASGRAEDGAAQARRIVSLGPPQTQQLRLLGAEATLAGVTSYCTREGFSPDARTRVVGTLTDPDIETIAALRPDLVLTTSMTSPRTLTALKRAGLKTEMFRAPASFEALCKEFLRLGALVGREDKAREILADVKTQVENIEKSLAGTPPPRVFVQVGSHPLFAAGPESFINDLIRLAGAQNVVERGEYVNFSRENVVALNPDVIIISTMGLTDESEKKAWDGFQSVRAVATARVYMMDAYEMCSLTPPEFAATLKKLVRLFHPERKDVP